MLRKHLSLSICTVALLAVPVAFWIENNQQGLEDSRLLLPNARTMNQKRESIHKEGTHLPERITQNTTLTHRDNPVILASHTIIDPSITLTVEEGVIISAHEHALLTVKGTFAVEGTKERPVVITSNEALPRQRVWGGIALIERGQARIKHTVIRHGSPGISCMDASTAHISHSVIQHGNIAIFEDGGSCITEESDISGFERNRINAQDEHIHTE